MEGGRGRTGIKGKGGAEEIFDPNIAHTYTCMHNFMLAQLCCIHCAKPL